MSSYKKILVLLNMSSTFDRGILRGIAKYVQKNSASLIKMDTVFYEEMGRSSIVEKIRHSCPDGLIVREPADSLSRGRSFEAIVGLRIPTVALATISNCPGSEVVICADNTVIGKMAADHLAEKGFRNFGYCGLRGLRWSDQRKESFRQQIAGQGKEVYVYDGVPSNNGAISDKEKESLAKWLKSLPKPIGIMACNDRKSQQIIDACEKAQISIPHDIALIGVDNDEVICDLSRPSISSIAMNTELAGYEGMATLNQLIMRRSCRKQKIVIVKPISVVCRFSTDVTAVEDMDVMTAVSFIQKNWHRPLQISDVAQAASVSKQKLCQKFRQLLGRSIHDEITRVRMAKVAQMLRDTAKPLSSIVAELGFNSERHLIRAFGSKMKISPGRYRKQFLTGKETAYIQNGN